MSKNQHLPLAGSNKKTDARVRRTRDALGDALIALMQEKAFETITVQEVLDRAHVSRSTFYTHYSDKDDLLMSDADEFFEALSTALSAHGDKSDRVFPVKEFSHISLTCSRFLRRWLSRAGFKRTWSSRVDTSRAASSDVSPNYPALAKFLQMNSRQSPSPTQAHCCRY